LVGSSRFEMNHPGQAAQELKSGRGHTASGHPQRRTEGGSQDEQTGMSAQGSAKQGRFVRAVPSG